MIMYLIDCHVHLGKIARYKYTNHTIEHLLAVMDRVGVSAFCLSSTPGLHGIPAEGNDDILDAFKKAPDRVIPLVALNPLFGIRESLAELEGRAQQGFKGVKLLPGDHKYHLDLARPIIKRAGELKLPVKIHSPKLDQLEPILEDYPESRILIAHCRRVDKERARIARRFPNVVVDISGMGLGGVGVFEPFLEICGAENMVFGSDLPCIYVGQTLKVIEASPVPEREKELILWKNAAKMFGIAPDTLTLRYKPQPWTGDVVDVCCGYGFDARSGVKGLDAEFDRTVSRYGITTSLVHAVEGLTSYFAAANEKSLEFCRGRPAEPLCVVNPGFLDDTLDEVRGARSRGFKGIMIAPVHGVWFDEYCIRRVAAEAADMNLPILVMLSDPGGGSMPVDIHVFLSLAGEHSQTPFVLTGLPARRWPLLYTAKDISNVCFGTAQFYFSDSLKLAAGMIGAERLVFESRFPYHDPGNSLGCVEESELSREDKARILSGNARRVFGLVHP